MGTGWLVALSIVWFLVAAVAGLWCLALMNDPAGERMPDGALAFFVFGGAALLIYGVPLGLGFIAYERAGAWIWLFYLLPHGFTALLVATVFVSVIVSSDRAPKRDRIRPPGRRSGG
jgi:hypothetical protein